MYKKIMVPLDGSELAECVLPHVEAFIKGFNTSDVILVHVVNPEFIYYGESIIDPGLVTKMDAEKKSFAKDYLDKVVKQLEHEGATLHQEIIEGRVPESLADYAVKNHIDLIIIATHGYSGVTRWVRGSVADKVLHSATVPVLMVRAPGTKVGI